MIYAIYVFGYLWMGILIATLMVRADLIPEDPDEKMIHRILATVAFWPAVTCYMLFALAMALILWIVLKLAGKSA